MRALSLFSGIGGLDLAAEWAGIQVVGQVEMDPYCRAVLAKHWPSVVRAADVREVQGDEFGAVDLLFGGPPCQPVSVAGKRRAQADDRWLWPEMRRVVRTAHPAWIVLENVAGFVRLVLDDVLADLAADGYEAGAVVLPACAVGAPHLRERVFLVADAVGYEPERGRVAGELSNSPATDAGAPRQRQRDGHAAGRGGPSVADTQARGPRCRTASWPGRQPPQRGEAARGVAHATSGDGRGLAPGRLALSEPGAGRADGRRDTGARGGELQAESRVGRDVDGPVGGLDGGGWLRYAWPAGPGEPQHPWEPPRTIAERIPHRAARLKALGNAVVPQQAYPIFAAIVAAEHGEAASA